ncbi:MAG: VWA domain-containing protein [Vicinamibacterales bacterium]
MTSRAVRTIALILFAGTLTTAARAAGQQAPFTATTEATAIDVNALDGSGTPVSGLGPADFDVRVDGRQRRVIDVQWISSAPSGSASSDRLPTVPAGFASNQLTTRQSGHLIVIAVDEVNLPPDALSGMQKAFGDFIDRVADANPVAIVGFGVRSTTTDFTRDRDRLKKTMALMRGEQTQSGGIGGFFDMSVSVAQRLAEGDTRLLETMIRRDCIVKDDIDYERCADQIRTAANLILQNANQQGETTESRLRALLTGLRAINAPKTLILVSQGFFAQGGVSRIDQLAALAAAAQTTIYGLAVDESAFARRRAAVGGVSAVDRLERIRALENLAGATRGTFLSLTGTGAPVLQRVARELSGYYLLGVESQAADNDGRAHRLRVDVRRTGVTVRARRSFVWAGVAVDAARTPRDAVTAALSAPIAAVGLPIRAAAVAFRDVDRSKLQLLVHAEVGNDYRAAANIAVGVTVTDRTGHVVGGQVGLTTLAPLVPGVPSPLPFVAGANVSAGDYTIKVAAADGDRVGSVEWTFHAGLIDLDGASSTDLVVGGPTLPADLYHPTVSSIVKTGTVHGYFEVYSPDAAAFSATYEIASDEQSPALVTAAVDGVDLKNDRLMFSRTINVEALPPGAYVLRAILRRDGQVLRTLTRAFDVVHPSSPAADVADAAAPAVPRFLPVDQNRLARPFDRRQLLEPSVLARFRDLVAADARELFDQGVTQYQSDKVRGGSGELQARGTSRLQSDGADGVSRRRLCEPGERCRSGQHLAHRAPGRQRHRRRPRVARRCADASPRVQRRAIAARRCDRAVAD